MAAMALAAGMVFVGVNALAASTESPAKPVENSKAKTYDERDREFKAKSVDELIAMLEKTPGNFRIVHRLRKLKDAKANAPLAAAFQKVTDRRQKQGIAAALVALGAKDDTYWTFLEGAAKKTIEDDMPFPVSGDKKSSEFLEWCKKRGLDPEKVGGDIGLAQSDILFLGLTEDRRALPILLDALKAKNPMVVDAAAMGLARFQYGPAIPEIIKAAKRLTPEMSRHMGRYLLLFKEDVAQAAADELIADKKSSAFVRAMSPEKQSEFILGE